MLSESREAGSSLLFSLREELDRWLGAVRGGNGTWSPATDMYPDEGELLIEMEMPGVDAGDVEILSEGQELTVRALTSDPLPPKNAQVMERRRGNYERTLFIPHDWDPGSTSAALKDGILTLRVPKAPEPEGARRIELGGFGVASTRPATNGSPVSPGGNGHSRPAPPAFLLPAVIGGAVDPGQD